jgi:coenzyme F420 hydrogenase subunit beta
LACCPGVSLTGNNDHSVWGNIHHIEEAWSSDTTIRHKASSGGVLTTLAIFLLENKKVDGILQVGVDEGSYLYNSLKISKTRDDIIRNIGSRYAPALVFGQLKIILDTCEDVYAFIGKPCDIAGIKNFITQFPEYKTRIKYFLSLFCAGMPSYIGTHKVLELAGHDEKPVTIKYRGDGWPGFFKADYTQHPQFKISYSDSWGKILGKYLCLRCKICPDGVGLLSDITVGDSWKTTNGYPDFQEAEGRSFVMVRNEAGSELYEDAKAKGIITSEPFDIKLLQQIQRYQFERRIFAGFRVIPVAIWTRFNLRFKKLGLFKIMLKANWYKGFKNAYGTCKRLIVKWK